MISRRKDSAGFTLVELLLAVSLSIMVFAAMGMLLTKCFSLWKDSTAHWRLTQYARISRERILSGVTTCVLNGATNLTGLLSATNADITASSGYTVIGYGRVEEPGVVYQIRGWTGEADNKNLQIKAGASGWVYALGSGTNEPDIKVDSFTASAIDHVVTIAYRLRLSAAGRTFYQQQTITTALLNEGD
jgi:hypothetical protein